MPPLFSEHSSHLASIRASALRAADPATAVRAHLSFDGGAVNCSGERLELASNARVVAVGAGKAGVAMARATAEVLGGRLSGGVIAVPQLPDQPVLRIEFIAGGHPMPGEGSLEAGRRIAALLESLTADDLVIALLSGGGSALMELLPEGIALGDLHSLTDRLLKSGATINELNTVRKSISRIKGGGLARLATPARVVGLILSDVVGDPLDIIASGPTVPDPSTPADARAVLERHRLWDAIPESIRAHLETAGQRPSKSAFSSQRPAAVNVIVGSNSQATHAAAREAERLGFRSTVLSTFVEGEAREVGRVIAGLGKSVWHHGRPFPAPACLVLGGETTVTVRGTGRGGRNQELALAAAIGLDGWDNIAVMSFGSDGVDGPTDAAGALATGDTVRRAAQLGLSAPAMLANNDAHTFFAALGDLVVTGPTGTNVNDLMVVLVYPVSGG